MLRQASTVESCVCHNVPSICFRIEPLFDLGIGEFEMRNTFGLDRRRDFFEDLEGEVYRWIYSCTALDADEPDRRHNIPDTISRCHLIKRQRVRDLIQK